MNDGPTKQSPADIRDQIITLLPRLRRFCLALTGTADQADDLAQSTAERVLSRLDQWQDGTRLDSWMFKIAQNMWIDTIRSRKTRGTPVGLDVLEQTIGEDGRRTVEQRSLVQRTRAAMAQLPEDQRVLVAMVLIDGQSYKEAAATLDIPIGTVMSRLARARKALDEFVFGADTAVPGGVQ